MKLEQIKALDPKRVIVLDTETTGLHPDGNDEILSLTIIDLEGTVIFDELVRPENRKRWPKAQEVHGITPAMVKDKQPLSAYREQLCELWKRIDLVVGYNVEFDSKFIYSSSVPFSPYVEEFDVMKEFAPIWGRWDERHNDYRWAKLTDCAKYYEVSDFEAHTSLGDTEATRQCFLALINDPKYVSGCHVMEQLAERNVDKTAQPLGKAPKKADLVSKLLTIALVAIILLMLVFLFIEWQMSVSLAFAFVFLLLLKAYHDGKRNENGGM
ncbi:MAG: 3'-5' exonuclease [Atopobiaceae bacterium]|nr:3'-5' exonuclease [Atopobiaceae bacterium]